MSLLLAGLCLAVHEDLERQIEKLTARLRAEPGDARLQLRRAELHRLHQDWPAARRDYREARRLDPGLAAEADLGLGRLELAAGRPEEALALLDAFVRAVPGEAAGRIERARVQHALGRHEAALRDYREGMALLPEPRPDHYVEYSRFARPLGTDRALACVEEGLRRHGPLVTLVDRALRLEIEAGRLEAALARVDALLPSLPRRDRWLEIRGDLLRQLGRGDEARSAYAAALREIEALPAARRTARETADLEGRLRRHLEAP